MTEVKKRKLTSRKNAKAKQPKTVVVQEVQESGEVVAVEKVLRKRTPIHRQKAVGIKEEAGWTYRQVVMKPGRVEQFKEADWEIVNISEDIVDTDNRLQSRPLGSAYTQIVNKHNLAQGDASSAVWMRIRTELYEEDQKDKSRINSEQENEIDPRRAQAANPDVYYTSTFKKENDF
jgi:hypothetical protein